MRYSVILIFLLLFSIHGFCQEETVIDTTDSIVISADSLKLYSDQPLKSPRGAMLRSLVVPGWGQFYNEKYVKAGLVFATSSFLIYHIGWYQYKWKEDKNKTYRGKRNLYSWYTLLAYLLNMADAYVDASLYKFDESMELSQRVEKREGKWEARIGISWHF